MTQPRRRGCLIETRAELPAPQRPEPKAVACMAGPEQLPLPPGRPWRWVMPSSSLLPPSPWDDFQDGWSLDHPRAPQTQPPTCLTRVLV